MGRVGHLASNFGEIVRPSVHASGHLQLLSLSLFTFSASADLLVKVKGRRTEKYIRQAMCET